MLCRKSGFETQFIAVQTHRVARGNGAVTAQTTLLPGCVGKLDGSIRSDVVAIEFATIGRLAVLP